jgi:hypothetical protein
MITLAQVLFAMHLVVLTGPDRQIILINPDEVVSLREPRSNEGHFTKGIACLVFTGDGKYTAVMETCAVVQQKLEMPQKE